MNKILHFILTPFMAILFIFLNIPDGVHKTWNWYPQAQLFIIGLLIIVTIYNYYITVISPYRELQAMKKKRWNKLNEKAEEIVKTLKVATNFDLSFNIMIPRRKFFCRLEPKGLTFFPKVFTVVWGYGTHRVHSHLRLTTNQGVCGMSYRYEDFYAFDLEGMRKENKNLADEFNMTNKQIQLTEKGMIVASYPIFQKEDEPDGQKTEIIGVLNLQCHTENSGILISDMTKREVLSKNMNGITKIYAA